MNACPLTHELGRQIWKKKVSLSSILSLNVVSIERPCGKSDGIHFFVKIRIIQEHRHTLSVKEDLIVIGSNLGL